MGAKAKKSIVVQLQRQGVLVLDVSELLVRILSNSPADSKNLASKVRDISKEGRKLAHSLVDKLNRMPVKPLDGNLLHTASQAMDGLLNLLEKVSSDSHLFKVRKPIPFTAEIAEVLSQQSREIIAALSGLSNGGPSPAHCDEIIRLKDEVDRLQESSIFNLFQEVKDPIALTKRKQTIDDLANASRAARIVGYILRSLTPLSTRI